ncbi:MAG: PAS domain-containing protein, partial [Chloroflexota bacterium]|nr:PAS domain-containing protein [Chloroflexota bacterium]
MLQARVLDSIVRASPDHFYLYDRAGRYLYASPSAAIALGIRQVDFIGKTWQDLGFPADTMLPLDVHREN